MPIPYFHTVVLCDLEQPILGFDFLLQFKLDFRWIKGQCFLVDGQNHQRLPLKMDTVNKDTLGLALLSFNTFKQYSQHKSELDSKKSKNASKEAI